MGNCPGGAVSQPAPEFLWDAPPLGAPGLHARVSAGVAPEPRKVSNKDCTAFRTFGELLELRRLHAERAALPAQVRAGSEDSEKTPPTLCDDPAPPCRAPSPRRGAPPRRTAPPLALDDAPDPGPGPGPGPTAAPGTIAAAVAAAVAAAAAEAHVLQKNQQPEKIRKTPARIPATSGPASQPAAAAGGQGSAAKQVVEPAHTVQNIALCTSPSGCDGICDQRPAPHKSAPLPLPAPERAALGEGPKNADTGKRAAHVAPPPRLSAPAGAPEQPLEPVSGAKCCGGPKKNDMKKVDSAFTAAPKKKAAAPQTAPVAAVPLAALPQQPPTGTVAYAPSPVQSSGERRPPPPERGTGPLSGAKKNTNDPGRVPHYMRPLQREPRARATASAAAAAAPMQATTQDGPAAGHEPSPRPPVPARRSDAAGPGSRQKNAAAGSSSDNSTQAGEKNGESSPSPVLAPCRSASGSSRNGSRAAGLTAAGEENGERGSAKEAALPTATAQRGGSEERRGSRPSSGSDARPRTPQGAQRPQPALTRAPSRRASPVSALVRFWRCEQDGNCVHGCGCAKHSVETMLAKKGQYGWLERKHHYVQWLFPKRESGVAGACAPTLTEEDAAVLAADQGCERRLLRAYTMMVDFWGFEQESDGGGLHRTAHCADRFANMQKNDHNWLRVTRVLLSCKLRGHDELAVQLVEALIDAVADGSMPGARASLVKYWIPALGGREAQRLKRRARDAGVPVEDTGSAYFNRGCRAALH